MKTRLVGLVEDGSNFGQSAVPRCLPRDHDRFHTTPPRALLSRRFNSLGRVS